MDKKLLALIGVAVTIVGLFLPIVSLPIVGSINMLLPGGGIGDGIFVLILIVVAGILALIGQVKHTVWPALASLGFIGYKFFELKGAVDAGAAQIAANPEAAGFVASVGSIEINWIGWIVLVVGSLIVLVAGATAWKSAPSA